MQFSYLGYDGDGVARGRVGRLRGVNICIRDRRERTGRNIGGACRCEEELRGNRCAAELRGNRCKAELRDNRCKAELRGNRCKAELDENQSTLFALL